MRILWQEIQLGQTDLIDKLTCWVYGMNVNFLFYEKKKNSSYIARGIIKRGL